MNSLCPIQTYEESGKTTTIQVCPKSNPMQLYSGNEIEFKGLDLMGKILMNCVQEVHDIVQETELKTIPRKMQKSKMVA